jgi:hypothetical protein
MHRKYDLRPIQRNANHEIYSQPKNLTPSISMDKVKELKNSIKPNEVGETSRTKKEIKDLEELFSLFNFEKDLSKKIILVMLDELAKERL